MYKSGEWAGPREERSIIAAEEAELAHAAGRRRLAKTATAEAGGSGSLPCVRSGRIRQTQTQQNVSLNDVKLKRPAFLVGKELSPSGPKNSQILSLSKPNNWNEVVNNPDEGYISDGYDTNGVCNGYDSDNEF